MKKELRLMKSMFSLMKGNILVLTVMSALSLVGLKHWERHDTIWGHAARWGTTGILPFRILLGLSR